MKSIVFYIFFFLRKSVWRRQCHRLCEQSLCYHFSAFGWDRWFFFFEIPSHLHIEMLVPFIDRILYAIWSAFKFAHFNYAFRMPCQLQCSCTWWKLFLFFIRKNAAMLLFVLVEYVVDLLSYCYWWDVVDHSAE